MPATEKQIEANRLNAQKSTGPKTDAGKIKSSQNAVIHGMYSHRVLIDSPQFTDDPEEFAALIESLYQELQPRSAFQESLVHTIADCLWRSQRAVFAETAQIQSRLADVEQSVHTHWLLQRSFPRAHLPSDSLDDPENCRRFRDNLIGECCIPYPKACQNIMRYEASLDRRLHRAYKLLETLQSRPLPAATRQTPTANLSSSPSSLSSSRPPLSSPRMRGPISHCEDDTEPVHAVNSSPVETREAVGGSSGDNSLSVGPCLRRDDKEEHRDDGKERRDDGKVSGNEDQQNEQTNPIDERPILPPLSRGDRGVCSDESGRSHLAEARQDLPERQNEQTNPFDERPILPPLSRGDRGVCSDECTAADLSCDEEQNEQTNPIASSQFPANCGRQASSPAPALRETCVPFRQPGTTAGHVVGREENEQTNPFE